MDLIVVVPALNEADRIRSLLDPLTRNGVPVIVVDGGSADRTVEVARACGAQVIVAERGRATQLHAGAQRALAAGANRLLFVHADSRLPAGWAEQVRACRRPWARFDVRLQSEHGSTMLLRLVGASMNLRSRLTGICTGDQGLFVEARAYQACGGYPLQPLMEDIELSARLKRHCGRPDRLPGPIAVSARRWVDHGPLRTIVSMWWFRLRYFFGVPPARLAAEYYRASAAPADPRVRGRPL
ncbi:MAG: TIGR04283 family arsenosugar biosynthesis glycosyltransferase [Burkholderiaceae bacterium]